MTRADFHRFVRLGAEQRLTEIATENAQIRKAFPDLFLNGAPHRETVNDVTEVTPKPARRKTYQMSPAQRAAVSARMTRYWAKRRKAAKRAAAARLL